MAERTNKLSERSSALRDPAGLANRFHIDVRSDMRVGDMEWASCLMLLNLVLGQQGMPYIEAHLEEYLEHPEATAERERIRKGVEALAVANNWKSPTSWHPPFPAIFKIINDPNVKGQL